MHTTRLDLRRITSDDVDRLLDLDSDPEVMRFLSNGVASTRAYLERRVASLQVEFERFPAYGRWLAFERETGDFVGWLALEAASGSPSDPEMGWRLKRRFWGRGYATEGALFLRDHAFASLGVDRVWADTMAFNVRSRAVMERIGMRHIATFLGEWAPPIPDFDLHEVVYAMTHDEWVAGAR